MVVEEDVRQFFLVQPPEDSLPSGKKRKKGMKSPQIDFPSAAFNFPSDFPPKWPPDFVGPNLDILFVGINPGITTAQKGHHYAFKGNQFWPHSGLTGSTTISLTCNDDSTLVERFKMGLTNLVSRCTASSSDLTKEEMREGAAILSAKLAKYGLRLFALWECVFTKCFPKGKKFHLVCKRTTASSMKIIVVAILQLAALNQEAKP